MASPLSPVQFCQGIKTCDMNKYNTHLGFLAFLITGIGMTAMGGSLLKKAEVSKSYHKNEYQVLGGLMLTVGVALLCMVLCISTIAVYTFCKKSKGNTSESGHLLSAVKV